VGTGAGALPFGEHPGFIWPRVLAAALSLSATGAFMVPLDVSHPPAGATTLIVSLGIIAKPRELATIEVAVFLLVAPKTVFRGLAVLPRGVKNSRYAVGPRDGNTNRFRLTSARTASSPMVMKPFTNTWRSAQAAAESEQQPIEPKPLEER